MRTSYPATEWHDASATTDIGGGVVIVEDYDQNRLRNEETSNRGQAASADAFEN